MPVTIIRAAILYIVVIFLVRLMGKRQIGELQPSELVITFLISEIASIPMQDNTIPILNSVVSLFILVALEIFISAIGLKSRSLRKLTQGTPIIVMKDGEIDIEALKKLRITVNDLIVALRQKDIFEPDQVSYAIFETNGKLSVLLKPEYRNATAGDMGITPTDNGMPFPVICDGEIEKNAAKNLGMDEEKIRSLASKTKINIKDIIVMTVNKGNETKVFKRKD